MSKSENKNVVEQELALSLFLESLLNESRVENGLETHHEVVPATLPQPVSPPEPVTVIPPVQPPEIVPDEDLQEDTAAAVAEPVAEPEADFGVPDWANEAFQALLFKAGGLTLAVPLVELSGVLEWPETISPMPGHADFYLGLVNHLDKSVPVVDTARLVLPQERIERFANDDPLERVSRIVLIDEGRWGLACDSVAEMVTLSPGEVRWRETRPNRPWLSGTVVEHMCAMIDGAAFASRLAIGDKDENSQ